MPYHICMRETPRKKIVIDDVAKRANVSTATVSRVINGFEGVSPEVAERVNSAIEELGYIRPVKNRESVNRNVGIVVPHIQNPYSCNLINEIQDTLENFGYSVVIMDSKNEPNKSLKCVDTLVKTGVSGLIYIPTHSESPQEESLLTMDLPMVFLGRKIGEGRSCFVGSETFNGAYNGANYLFSLGHKDILYITGNTESILSDTGPSTDKEGFSGFLKAHKEKGIDFNYDNLVSGDYSISRTTDVVNSLLDNRNFTAIFTSGDVMAYGAYKAVINRGLTIPDDISILGFDDLPMSSVLDLTTISQNAFGIGQNAALLLHDLIEKRKQSPQEIILPTNLCIRSTCGICK